MNILVIGTSVIDEIHQNGKIEIKAGGIFYTIAGLLFSSKQYTIDLVTNYKSEFGFYFDSVYNTINLIVDEKNQFMPNVKLKIFSDREREETYSGFTKKLTIPSEINYSIYDAILINMISGLDISIEDLEEIRKKFNGIIYLDVHSLARGFDENQNRIFRKIKNSEKLLRSVDIIQCNENELTTLFDEKIDEEKIIKTIKGRLKFIIVTRGKQGAEIYDENKKLAIETPHNIKAINTVGCGDIFGAVFFSSYISSLNYDLALSKSVETSSKFTQFENVFEFLDKGNEL